MTDRQDKLLANEDPRFYAIDKTGTSLSMLSTSETLANSPTVDLGLPSDPALFLNIAQAAHQRRSETRVSKLFDLHPQGRSPDAHGPLFDYLQDAVTEVIMSYSAIEAAINELIGTTSTCHRPSKGGRPSTTLVGNDIERKVSLDEKLRKAIPAITGIASPAGGRLWDDFVNLELVRGRMIHLRVRLRNHRCAILRSSKLPMATWIIASETSRRFS